MQAVILAAGKSTRTYPLTLTKPKPLLRVLNTTIIEHNLDQLRGLVEEVIIVVGYKADMIESYLGDRYRGMKLRFVLQEETSGNASALALVREHITGRFILMFGDDLYSHRDIRRLLAFENAILAQKVDNPSNFGVLKTEGNRFLEVVEKPQEFVGDLVNIGCFVFTPDIFQVLDEIELSSRGEYELTDAYNLLAEKKEITVVPVEDYWLATTYPWSLLTANACLLDRLPVELSRKAKVERGAVLKGKVTVGEHTVIKSGTYIEGPVLIGKRCVIGPNAYLRAGTTLGDECHVGQAVEIKNSILGSRCHVAHLSYVGDSILGEDVNLGAGTITANLRHDGGNIRSQVGEKVVDCGSRKLGAVLGDGCKTGVHTSLYPGVKLDPGARTVPGEAVRRDLRN
jgi:bifunctional UDP-N-acetylglucosamine pyrophosphorylase/glucosamine-1-phosphate N-acetyltransferase